MESSDEEDVHICGRCKLAFNDLEHYVIHKKANYCRKQKSNRQNTSNSVLSEHSFDTLPHNQTDPDEIQNDPRLDSSNPGSYFEGLDKSISSSKPDHDYSRSNSKDIERSRNSAKKLRQASENNPNDLLIIEHDEQQDAVNAMNVVNDDIFMNPQPILIGENIVSNQLIIETSSDELQLTPAVAEQEESPGQVANCERNDTIETVSALSDEQRYTENETSPKTGEPERSPSNTVSTGDEIIIEIPEEAARSQSECAQIENEVASVMPLTKTRRKRKRIDYLELSEGISVNKHECSDAKTEGANRGADGMNEQHICRLCTHSFNSNKKLTTHKKLDHKYHCTITDCEQRFTSNINLETHIQQQHPLNTSVMCPVCKRLLTRRHWTWCEHHEKLHTPMHSRAESDVSLIGQIPSMDGDRESLSTIQCPICCRILTDEATFNDHIDLHKVWVKNEDKEGDHSTDVTADVKNCEEQKTDTDKLGYPCYTCSAIFNEFEDAQNHKQNVHNLRRIFRCIQPKCQEEFTDRDSFIQHNESHSQSACICRVCNDHFTDRGMLMSHQARLHKSSHCLDGFRCDKCGRVMTSQKCLDEHMARVEHEYSCDYCDKIFTNSTKLNNHISINHEADRRSNLCDICGMSFPRKPLLKRHLQLHDTETDAKKCPYCGRTFEMKEYLSRHVRTMHMNWRPLQCTEPGCGKRFVTKSKLDRHIDTHNKDRKFECSMCGKKYRSRDVLYKHCKAFCSQFCDVCKESFAHQEELEIHAVERHPHDYYFCQFCYSVGETLTDLKQHIIHQHLKKIKRMFMTKVNLTDEKFQNMPAETKQSLVSTNRPMIMLQLRKNTTVYRCDEVNCGKEFKEKKKLKDHVRTHSIVKGIHCQFCDFVTKTQDSYRKHRRRSHTCKIYPCNAVIGSAADMNEHLIQAHPEYNDQLVCHLCPKLTTFNKLNEYEYRKHLDKHTSQCRKRRLKEDDESTNELNTESTGDNSVRTSIVIEDPNISQVVTNSANSVEIYQISYKTVSGNVETTDILLVQN